MKRKNNITIAYQEIASDEFMSNVVYTKSLLGHLGEFVRTNILPADPDKVDFGGFKLDNSEYLLVDIKNFGVMQFLAREKENVDLPFILILHTVYDWFPALAGIIPLLRSYDIVIAPSQYTRKLFYNISRKIKVEVIPNCLDVKMIGGFSSARADSDRKVIGFMGRLSRDRGIEFVIECMPEIVSRVKDAHLNVIGPMSGHLMKDRPKSLFTQHLEKRVHDLSLEERVHFHGIKLGAQKYKILSGSDVFVSPTTHEYFGVSVLEALALGIPVVTTDSTASKELISAGRNGFLFGCRFTDSGSFAYDRRKFISCVSKILNNEKLSERMRANARASAEQYDFRTVIPRFLKYAQERGRIKHGRIAASWEALRAKKVLDFKDVFTEKASFFIDLFGIGNTAYSSIYARKGLFDIPFFAGYPADTSGRGSPAYESLMRQENLNLLRYLTLY